LNHFQPIRESQESTRPSPANHRRSYSTTSFQFASVVLPRPRQLFCSFLRVSPIAWVNSIFIHHSAKRACLCLRRATAFRQVGASIDRQTEQLSISTPQYPVIRRLNFAPSLSKSIALISSGRQTRRWWWLIATAP